MDMKKTFLIVALIMLTWSGTASGALDRIEEAYELDAGQLRFPTYTTDQVIIRPCDTCEPQRLQATDKTTYRIGNRNMALDRFLQAMSLSRDKKDQLITVFYRPETLEVTRIVVAAAA